MNQADLDVIGALAGARAQALRGSCILCGEPAEHAQIFKPNNSQEFGAARGRSRMVVYGICGDCYERGVDLDAVERRIHADLVTGWSGPQ